MKFPSKIFLIGLPGSGKTTVGKYLADEFSYAFIDLDDQIENTVGKSVTEIFEEEGEARFRLLEKDALRDTPNENVVVSTGGGAPIFHENMGWMNANGFTVFLNPSLEEIIGRIHMETHRPLLAEDPVSKLRKLSEERLHIYKKAGLESSQSEPCEILTELHNFFRS